MIFPADYENACNNVRDTIRKLELDLELHKVLHAYLQGKVAEERRKNPPVVNTSP